MLRFESCMSMITYKCQTVFIKGRNIADGIMCLLEIPHDTWIKNKEGFVIKLDFEKVYDKICWEFPIECLVQRGFSEKWCS